MDDRSCLQSALSETLRRLDCESMLPRLDQALDDLSCNKLTPEQVGLVLQSLGLNVKEGATARLNRSINRRQIAIGIGKNSFTIISKHSFRKYLILDWDTAGRVSRKVVKNLTWDSGIPWLIVRQQSEMAPLASPGGRFKPWQRLFKLIHLERKDVWTVALYATILGALSLLIPIATQALVNTIALGTVIQPLLILIIVLFIGLSLAATLRIIQTYLVEVFQRRLMVRVAEDFGERLPLIAQQARDRSNMIELNNRFLDIITVQKSAAELLLTGLTLVLQGSVGILLLGFYHPFLQVFNLLLIGGISFVVILGKGGTRTAVAESSTKFAIAAWLDEIARQPQRFRGGQGRMLAAQELSHRTHAYVKARRRHYSRVFAILVGGNMLQVFMFVGLLAMGGWLVIKQQLTLGQLVAAELVVSTIASGVTKFGTLADKTFDLVAGVDKLGVILDLPLDAIGTGLIDNTSKGIALDVQQLKVNYGDEKPFPMSLSFSLAPGEKALLDGPSGSGKSAVLEAIAGWRSPYSGTICWDKHSNFNKGHYALKIWVLRTEEMLAGSILSNLRIANTSLASMDAWKILKDVGLEKAVELLKDGLDTQLLPSGCPLSPTQVQRLRFAQVLAANPRLLVIDEALDGLGKEDEELIDRIIGPKTPWTCLVTTNDVRVRKRLKESINLQPEKKKAKKSKEKE